MRLFSSTRAQSELVVAVFVSYCLIRIGFSAKPAQAIQLVLQTPVHFPAVHISLLVIFAIITRSLQTVGTKLDRVLNVLLLILIGMVFLIFDFQENSGGITFDPKNSDSLEGQIFTLILLLPVLGLCLYRSRKLLLENVREWLPLILIICLYPLIPILIEVVGIPDKDTLLSSADQWIFLGTDPTLALDSFNASGSSSLTHTIISEWCAFSYIMYAGLFLITTGIHFLNPDLREFRRCSFALCLALSLGYIGYTIVPALGPVFTQTFPHELNIHLFKTLKIVTIDNVRINRDCFPSLHTCISIVLEWSLYRSQKKLFVIFLPIVMTMPFACVYLRYHYVVDILAGILLSIAVIIATLKIQQNGDRAAQLQ